MADKTAPRRKATRRASQEIVTAVLDAASELVADKGVGGASTNAIAARAGVSVGSLYHYFPNKESIIAAVTKRSNDVLQRAVRDALRSDGSVKERFHAAVQAYLALDTLPLRAALLAHVPRGWESSGIESTERVMEELVREVALEVDPSGAAFDRLWLLTMTVRGTFQGSLRRRELIENGTLSRFLEQVGDAVLDEF